VAGAIYRLEITIQTLECELFETISGRRTPQRLHAERKIARLLEWVKGLLRVQAGDAVACRELIG